MLQLLGDRMLQLDEFPNRILSTGIKIYDANTVCKMSMEWKDLLTSVMRALSAACLLPDQTTKIQHKELALQIVSQS